MATKVQGNGQKRSKRPVANDKSQTGPLALNTLLNRTFAAIVALVGLLAGIAVFTAPFAKTGSALISITLAVAAAIMLAGAGFAALYAYRTKKITTSVSALATIAALVLLIGAGAGYIAWHARSSRTASTGTPAAGTPAAPSTPANSTIGYTAQVAWTDDGFGGGSASTTLYAFATPHSHIHDGAYPLGEFLTVVCQTSNCRAIQVGPAYKGPGPHSKVWYQMDNGAWVPAVYIQLAKPGLVPACT